MFGFSPPGKGLAMEGREDTRKRELRVPKALVSGPVIVGDLKEVSEAGR